MPLGKEFKSAKTGRSELLAAKKYAVLFSFIDTHIEGFATYFTRNNSNLRRENSITARLTNYLQEQNDESDKYFRFTNQWPIEDTGLTTDIGVIKNFSSEEPFCCVEAKRLETTTHSTQYVHGSRGGIERFKRELHGAEHRYAIMVGYIQKHDVDHWLDEVNGNIRLKADNEPTEDEIEWSYHEQLKKSAGLFGGLRCVSRHSRKSGSKIELRHFWINL